MRKPMTARPLAAASLDLPHVVLGDIPVPGLSDISVGLGSIGTENLAS